MLEELTAGGVPEEECAIGLPAAKVPCSRRETWPRPGTGAFQVKLVEKRPISEVRELLRLLSAPVSSDRPRRGEGHDRHRPGWTEGAHLLRVASSRSGP